MKTLSSLIFLCLNLVITSSHANMSNSISLGEAFSYEGESLLYREVHCQLEDNLQREVFYLDPQGKLIAYKTLDYRHGSATPAFVQKDFQTDQKTEVSFEQDKIKLLYETKNTVASEKRLDFELQQTELPIVVDAGFDNFIRQHWDSLIAGESQRFRFALPGRGQLVDLKVSSSRCSYPSEQDQCFVMNMDNWLYRMLVDSIELGYNPESRQLTRYRGLSNIEDANGDGITVDIRYSYTDLPAQACLNTQQNAMTH